jgi:hypothetical protein
LRIVDAAGGLPSTWEDTQNTLEATTQADLFNPDRNGLPFGGGQAEPTSCGATTYANTVWYDLAPSIAGGVELSAAGFDSTIALYEFDPNNAQIKRLVGCQNAGSGVSESFVVPTEVMPGRSYTVQVGGVATPLSIASGPLSFGFAFYPDRDGDLTLDEEPDTCLERRGVREFGGCPPSVRAAPNFGYDGLPGRGVRLTELKILHMPQGGEARAVCRRCGISQVVKVRPGSTTVRFAHFIGRTLPNGSALELYVTRKAGGTGKYRYGAFGHYIRYLVRGSELGSRRDRCLLPGKSTPLKTCR